MKKNQFFSAVFSLFVLSVGAQTSEQNPSIAEVEYKQNTKFAVTAPLRDIAPQYAHITEEELWSKHADTLGPIRRPRPEVVNANALPYGPDPVAQTEMGIGGMRAPLVNINGQSGAFPPDPTGAAGQNHYVQGVNTSYRIYNKDGSTSGLPPSLPLSSL